MTAPASPTRSSQFSDASDNSITARMAWHQAVTSRRILRTVVRSMMPAMPDTQPPRAPIPVSQRLARAQTIQNRWIAWGGFALPVGSITLLLAFGIPIGHSMLPLTPEDGDALRIEVTGHQWWWEVHYPDSGIELTDEVHIPANTPVDVHLTSNDVIHSFWVPRLGGKVDMLPGHTNVMRLEADEAGTCRGSCAEFCGTGHTRMQFVVTAHEPEDFAAWQQDMTGGDE